MNRWPWYLVPHGRCQECAAGQNPATARSRIRKCEHTAIGMAGQRKTSIQAVESRARRAQFPDQFRCLKKVPVQYTEKMMKLSKFLIALGLVAVATPVLAQSALEQIKQAGALRIGTEGTYAPFTYHDDSGALVGFDVEIGRAIAEQLGVEAEFVEGPWDGLIAGIDANRYDVVINQVGINAERQAKYDFSEPYIASKAALVVRGDNADITSFESLAGKKAAQTLTSNYGKLAQEFGAELVPTEGFDQSIALVVQGRADATINDSLSFFDFKKQQPDADVKIVATQADADFSGVLLAKGKPELLAAINEALAAIKADGTYAEISQKYFGEDVSQ
jgi:cystine transport system substrate-binding protein